MKLGVKCEFSTVSDDQEELCLSKFWLVFLFPAQWICTFYLLAIPPEVLIPDELEAAVKAIWASVTPQQNHRFITKAS